MGSLSGQKDRDANWTVGTLGTLRWLGGYSKEDIVRKLDFDTVEEMRTQLQKWDLPGWLVGEELGTNPTKKTRKKGDYRARDLAPVNELPPAGNATELFKERLEALLESAELLRHMNENLHGKHFVRTNVEKAPVFWPRERFSKEEWEAVCEQHELKPEDKGLWYENVLIRLPGGAKLAPSEIEATLIGVYALADGQMDLLLDALHPDSLPVRAETREGIRTCVEGSKADGDKRDGMKVLARQLATWVRGSKVDRGRPSALSKADHAFACRITHDRKHGLTDEEIARKESHRKKEDGTSYSVKDIAELGDLGLNWL
jgi:hypothetical protein